MNLEDIKKVMQKVCPEMLSSDNFMNNAVEKYINGDFIDGKTLSKEEYETWDKLQDVIGTATIGQLIKHLKDNFKPTDKLCYMDCVEGLKNDCTYVTKDQLGSRFFYYVKAMKESAMKNHSTTKQEEDYMFPHVDDNDVVIV